MGTTGSTVANPLARYTVQSPQVAAVIRYAEFPVSPATGILDISIPIYTIQTDGVTVPVSISYHASGIKVNDVATPVGLGWTLNAGGVIGSSTNGVRDNLAQSTIRTEADFQQALRSGTVPCNSLRNIANGEGTVDTESDRYVYCFNGHTGCFRFDYTSNAAVPHYNGNNARQQWQVGGESILRGYDFMYDRHSRLVAAAYGEGASLTSNRGRYDEGVARYNTNGAIVQLMRNGRHDNGSYGTVDYLAYTLDGNRPVKITDTATSPTYSGSFN